MALATKPLSGANDLQKLATTDPTAFATLLNQQAQELIDARGYLGQPSHDEFYKDLLSVYLTRKREALDPTPAIPESGPLDVAEKIAAKQYESAKLTLDRNAIIGAINLDRSLRQFRQKYPEVSDEIGLTEDWFNRLQEHSISAANKGYKAVDVVLRNLDRGRGAIVAYNLHRQQGGDVGSSLEKAKHALQGSPEGFRWIPASYQPSFKEVLLGMGFDDSMLTGAFGLATDILVDPVNLFGEGLFTQTTKRIGAQQFLNKTGRLKLGDLTRDAYVVEVASQRVRNMGDLSFESHQAAQLRAAESMRALINKSPEDARKYLDLGGMKFAGVSLTSPLPTKLIIKPKLTFRAGQAEFDLVPRTMSQILFQETGEALRKHGSRLQETATSNTGKILGEFMNVVPDRLAQIGNDIRRIASRSNPAAGKEYLDEKQANFYDVIGQGASDLEDRAGMIFRGINREHLEQMTHAIEEGIQAQYINQITMAHGAEYGNRVNMAMTAFSQYMDKILIDEVRRGFFYRNWTDQTRQLFVDWMEGKPVQLSARQLQMFEALKKRNYVPHVYWNFTKADKIRARQVTSRAPSVTEPFTHRRVVPTIAEAMRRGLKPETNLRVLMTIRGEAYVRAGATYDFLKHIRETYGIRLEEWAGNDIIFNATAPIPRTAWGKIARSAKMANGKTTLPLARQKEIALRMAFEANVPPAVVAMLDDEAIRQFLFYKLRIAPPSRATQIWKNYVAKPTKEGLYDGIRVAPDANAERSFAIAKDVYDPVYKEYVEFKAGGVGDPKSLRNVWLPREIADDLSQLRWDLIQPQMRRLIRGADAMMYWWKRSVTVPFFAFHVRNKITNILNSAMEIGLAGVIDRQAMHEIMAGKDGFLKTVDGNISYSAIRKAARRYGVVRPFYKRYDLTQLAYDVASKESKTGIQLARKYGWERTGQEKLLALGESTGPAHVANPFIAPFQAGHDIGLVIENSDRMQLFAKSVQRGMTFEQAARRVDKFLFDYDDISVLNRDFIRRLFFPFWTWTSKNLRLQAELATHRPARWAVPGKFARALSSEDDKSLKSDVERVLLPQHLNDQFGVRLGTDGTKLAYWMLNADIPAETLNIIWQGSMRRTALDWFAMLGPYQRAILEDMIKFDFYRGQSTVSFERGMRMYSILNSLPDDWKKALKMKKVLYRDREELQMDPKMFNALMWGTLWQGSRLYHTVGRTFSPEEGSIYERLFSLFTGMRIESINPEDELRKYAENILVSKDESMLKEMAHKWKQAQRKVQRDKLLAAETDKAIDSALEQSDIPIYPGEDDFEDLSRDAGGMF